MNSETENKPRLLIVDDEKPTREGLRAALEGHYEVWVAEDAKAATLLLEQENFQVLLTDFRLPQEDGMKLILRAKSLSRPPICILMTAYGSEELAVQAMKEGADDYIAKGRLQIDELELRIDRALRRQNLETENVALRQQLSAKFGLENIVAESAAMKEAVDMVRQVAPTRATVLLLGESGTGIAPPSRRRCWKANSSAMRKAPSPARTRSASAGLSRRREERCSWMKSGRLTPPCKSSFCVSWGSAPLSGSARTKR
jgi:DNA-binding NtrC family response regulator